MSVFKLRQIAAITFGLIGAVLFTATAHGQNGQVAMTPALVTLYAGSGSVLGDNGNATAAKIVNPRSMIVDASGNIYIADAGQYRIRKVTTAGVISTIAGTGTQGSTGNGGLATAATINQPTALALDSTGTYLYFSEGAGNDVRVINLTTGIVTLFAGTGTAGTTGDGGSALSATLSNPSGLAVDASGNVYVSDSNSNRVRKISGGTISAFAGTGTSGSTGDNGQAVSALLNLVRNLAFDSAGNLYIADYGNSRIRKVNTSGVISTVVGTGVGGYSGDGGQATLAKINSPRAIGVDAAGDLYIADGINNVIRKVDTLGIITTFAGGATTVCSAKVDTYGDGCFATQATLNLPIQASLDSASNLYISDYNDNVIRKVSVATSSIAFGNQPLNSASAVQSVTISNTGAGSLQFTSRAATGTGFAIAASGGTDCTATTLLAPGASCLIGVKFTPTAVGAATGTVTITDNAGGVAGTTQTFALTGTGTQPLATVALNIYPTSASAGQSITFTATVTASGSSITPTGTVQFLNGTTVLGSATLAAGVGTFASSLNPGTYSVTASYSGDGTFLAAVSTPATTLTVAPLAADTITFTATPPTGIPGSTTNMSVTVAQSTGSVVPTGSVSFLDGSTVLTTKSLVSGQATYSTALSTATHSLSATYAGDANYNPLTSSTVLVTISAPIVTNGLASLTPAPIAVFAGGGTVLGDGGASTLSQVTNPRSIVFDAAGNMYIADAGHYRIRKVTTAGVISTIAGTGTSGLTGNGGLATAATLTNPTALALDPTGVNLYEAEGTANVVRVINLTTGIINNFAGNGTAGSTGDTGAATSAELNLPSGLAVDTVGNVYISDTSNNKIRKVATTGIITTFAGTGVGSGTGDNGQATSATFYNPRHIAFDAVGNLYIADLSNNKIRKINTSGVVTTVAGTGATGVTGDGGLATAATMNQPRGVSVDAAGDLLIADGVNNKIRKVDTAGIITTLAGGATTVCSAKTDTYGDGCLATQATFNLPFQAIVDGSGNVYIVDFSDSLIRKISTSSTSIAFGTQPINSSSAVQTVTLSNTGNGTLQLSGRAITGTGLAIVASGGTDCTATTLLAVGASCQVGIQFSPTTTGAVTGTITLTDNAGGATAATQTIALTGTGVQPTPTVALTVNPSTVTAGQNVTFTATVTFSGSVTVPTGTVQFLNGTTVLGSATLSAGVATFTSAIYPGTYSVVASYGGDANYLSAVSTPASSLTVNPLSGDAITLTATPATGAPGSTTSISATVAQTSGSVRPTGTVTFFDGTLALSTQTLVAGLASYSAKLPSGSNSLTAVYNGDANFAPITSTAQIVTIGTTQSIAIAPGILTDFAGTGTAGNTSGNGDPTAAKLNGPTHAVFDAAGNMYFSDTSNNEVRKITPGGNVSVFAGTGTAGHTGDNGQATLATLSAPRGLAFDSLGNLYIADANNNDIRRVDTTGNISTFAGIPTTASPNSSSGDGGQATAANMNNPRALAFDAAGNLYVAEYVGDVIRKITPAGIISTIAGKPVTPGGTGNGGLATSALLSSPMDLGFDPQGNLYIAEYGENAVRVINTAGIINLYAGKGTSGYTGDGGLATSATLAQPRALAVDNGGNLYIGDTSNYVVRRVDSSGVITTIAGSDKLGSSGNGGAATAGTFNQIYGISLDAAGNFYIEDQAANNIRKVNVSSGILAFPNQIPNTTSSALSATIYNTGGLPLSLSGISLANTTGTAFALSASGGTDCTATTVLAAGASCLIGVKFTPTSLSNYSGTVTVTDNSGGVAGSQQLIQLTGTGVLLPAIALTASPASVSAGVATTIAVTLTNSAYPAAGTPTGTVAIMNGSTLLTTLTLASGTASYSPILPAGSYSLTAIYSGDSNFNSVTSTVTPLSVIGTNSSTALTASATTLAQGTAVTLTATVSSTTGTPTGSVTFSTPAVVLGTANLTSGVATLVVYLPLTGTDIITATYSGDAVYNPSSSPTVSVTVTSGVVASITPGIISTYAGDGYASSTGDGGQAIAATINLPGGAAAIDAAGNLYIPDTNGNRVRKVTPSGVISTIAGNGAATHTGDGGLATAATLSVPRGIALDQSGNIFILEAGYNVVRKIDVNGIISTYAGTPLTTAVADTGDGGLATAATINTPRGIATDAQGNLYIAENGGNLIRKVNTSGIISTFAGSANPGSSGNGGLATVATLRGPDGVAVDGNGNVYIADTSNSEIRMVSATTGIITLIAGTGTSGYTGDGGLATSAKITGPRSVAVDAGGNVYIADTGNNVVRKVDANGYISTIVGTGVSGYFGDGGSATLAQIVAPFGVTVDTASNLYIVDNASSVIRKLTTSTGLQDFGSIPFSTTSTATVTLGNSGTQPLTLTAITITGAAFTEATPTTRGCTSTTTLAPGSDCLLAVTFAPPALGQYTGSITYTDNAGKPQVLSLTGIGIKLPATVVLTSTPQNYTLPGGAVSLTVKVSSTNLPSTIATGSVQFYSGSTLLGTVTLDSTGTAVLSLGTTLAAAEYTFSAKYLGDTNFQTGSSQSLDFWVQNDFAISLSSTSGLMSPGGSLTTNLTITPAGLLPATVQMACINQPVYISCVFSPQTFAASASPMTATVTITSMAYTRGSASTRWLAALSLLLVTFLIARWKRKVWLQCVLAVALMAGLSTLSGCSNPKLQPAIVPVTISVNSGGATHTLVYNINYY